MRQSRIKYEYILFISMMNSFSFSNASPPDVELLVTLNVSLVSTQRLTLINDLFTNNVTLNGSYALTVRIIPNPVNIIFGKFSITLL